MLKLKSNTQLTVLRSDSNLAPNKIGLLHYAISSGATADIILDALKTNQLLRPCTNTLIAIPEEWNIETDSSDGKTINYKENIDVCLGTQQEPKQDSWLTISNGRFIAGANDKLLAKLLAIVKEDVIAINVKPQLLAYREKIRLTHQHNIVGFRRSYTDSVEPAPDPIDWPHHILIKGKVIGKLFSDNVLPSCFSDFIKMCSTNLLNFRAVNIGGFVLDLETENTLLNLCKSKLNSLNGHDTLKSGLNLYRNTFDNNVTVSRSAKLFGKVSIGDNVTIGNKTVIVGPTIIGDNVKIGHGAIINSSIIGPNISVPQNQYLNDSVIADQDCLQKKLPKDTNRFKHNSPLNSSCQQSESRAFCTWPKFSYVRFLKRFADVIGAMAVIVLFAPIVPFIALALKINSPGPLFFKARRQGLHGKEFNCIKFRTMIIGADKMQDQLRVINQMDGPQFKIDNDPRVSSVGRFLRDTFIDEIPQFFNVLIGQMSIVGPRPSPQKENTLCPSWRDARLSVRPGITGLWQTCRTRQPELDFQEWIHYDIKYVKNLSLRLDLWICWGTAKQMFEKFISKF